MASGGVVPLLCAAGSAAGWGVVEVRTGELIEKISNLLPLLTGFTDAHNEIESAQTAMHQVSEHVHLQFRHSETSSSGDGKLSDPLDELLKLLDEIGHRY